MTVDVTALADLLRRAAKAEIMPRFRRLGEGDVRAKTEATDLVTEADESAERMMRAELAKTLPNAVFIGEESGFEALEECSVVTAPYSVEGRVLGVLGVIGPTRMAYDRVIPVVDVTARLLAATLNSQD